ncbi:MAG: glycosyltransferase [Gammaproteobacteria bacterium]
MHKTSFRPAGRVSVITRGTIGLVLDAKIVRDTLANSGIATKLYRARGRNMDGVLSRLKLRFMRSIRPTRSPDANIFIEQVPLGWHSLARMNFLIPNQEWCRPETMAWFDRFDLILCKSRFAERIFLERGLPARYIGFTSEDRFRAATPKDYSAYLHVAGRSTQKGTRSILQIWRRHPEWPNLTVVAHGNELDLGSDAHNLEILRKKVPYQQLVNLQNRCGVHLCPSEAEGFGHYIGEGLSCGAVVVTTDAPPMNELVASDHGIVVPYSHSRPQSLGMNYYVDTEALEAEVAGLVAMTDAQKQTLGSAAREFFLSNKRLFEQRLCALLWSQIAGGIPK